MNYTIITGASTGIGLELAYEFARHRHNVILVARTESKLKDLKIDLEKKFPIKAEYIVCDLTKKEDVNYLFDQIEFRDLQINILVNNAGFGELKKFEQSELLNLLNMIQLNITALTELTYRFLPILKTQKQPKILNVSSVGAFFPGPYMAVYYATKAYVQSFSEALHEELLNEQVAICTLCPGPTRTEFQTRAHFTALPLSTDPKSVAGFAYTSLMQNRAVAVHGWTNRVMLLAMRFTPRFLNRKLVKRVQEKRAL